MINNVNLSKQSHSNDPAFKELDDVHSEILKTVHGFKTYKEYDTWLRSKEGKAKTDRVENIIKQRFGITVTLVDNYGKIYAVALPFKEDDPLAKEKVDPNKYKNISKSVVTAYHKQATVDVDKLKVTGSLSKLRNYILISYWDLCQDNGNPRILSVAVLNAIADILNAFALMKTSDSSKKDLYDLAESLGNDDKEQRKRALSNLMTSGFIDSETTSNLIEEDNNTFFFFKFVKGFFKNITNMFSNNDDLKSNSNFLVNLGYVEENREYRNRSEKYADLAIKHFILSYLWSFILLLLAIACNSFTVGILIVPAFISIYHSILFYVYFFATLFAWIDESLGGGSGRRNLTEKEAIASVSNVVNVNGVDSFTKAKYTNELSEQTKLLEDSSKSNFSDNPIFNFFSSKSDNDDEGLLSSITNGIKSGLNKIGIG